MNLCFRIAATAIALAVAHTANASPYRFDLTISGCSHAAVPVNVDGKKDPAWIPFAPFIETCPVFGPKRRMALKILTIRRDLIEKESDQDDVPDDLNQQVFGLTGQYLGSLLQTFPLAYPETIALSFQDWRQNFPRKIVEKSSDNLGLSAAGGDLTIFLWDQSHGKYVRKSLLPASIKPNKN